MCYAYKDRIYGYWCNPICIIFLRTPAHTHTHKHTPTHTHTHTHTDTHTHTHKVAQKETKAHNRECQNLPFPTHIKPVKANLKLVSGFLFFASPANGLRRRPFQFKIPQVPSPAWKYHQRNQNFPQPETITRYIAPLRGSPVLIFYQVWSKLVETLASLKNLLAFSIWSNNATS